MEEGEGQNENSGESDEAPPKVISYNQQFNMFMHFVNIGLFSCTKIILKFMIIHYYFSSKHISFMFIIKILKFNFNLYSII